MSKLSKERYYNYTLQHMGDEYVEPTDITPIEKAVYKLWADVTDRRGIKQEFDACDEDVQEEIMNTWAKLIEAEL